MQMFWMILTACVKTAFALNFSRVYGIGKAGETEVFLTEKT